MTVLMQSTEAQARAVGENRKSLKNRLNEAKQVLKDEYLAHFRKPVFDFGNKRLVGDNGYFLQWKLREEPDQPISYDNQQTSRGTVMLLRSRPKK